MSASCLRGICNKSEVNGLKLLQGFMGIYLVTWLLLLWPAFLGAQVTQLVAEAKVDACVNRDRRIENRI